MSLENLVVTECKKPLVDLVSHLELTVDTGDTFYLVHYNPAHMCVSPDDCTQVPKSSPYYSAAAQWDGKCSVGVAVYDDMVMLYNASEPYITEYMEVVRKEQEDNNDY